MAKKVIEIPEEVFNGIMSADDASHLSRAFLEGSYLYFKEALQNSKPLPKGHGKIGDLDALIQTMKELNDDNGGEPLNAVDRGYDLAYQHMVEVAKECVIIEADKKEENNE